jgi:hypothetical protein
MNISKSDVDQFVLALDEAFEKVQVAAAGAR